RMKRILAVVGSIVWILLVLFDAFESMVLPRRVMHPYRFTRFFFRVTWGIWRPLAAVVPARSPREAFLSVYGPLALLSLFATWMAGLILGFAALHWALGTSL